MHENEAQEVLIKDVACGESHTMALSLDGSVYSWGGGQMG